MMFNAKGYFDHLGAKDEENKITLRKILENPPSIKVPCSSCNGTGTYHYRCQDLSQPCSSCSASGEIVVIDYDRWEELIVAKTRGGKS